MQELYRKIYRDPEFHALETRRRRFSWTLAGLTFGLYLGFILVIAFVPELFATPISESSVITWGIPCGIAVIVISFIFTGIYIRRANSEFDTLSKKIVDKIRNSHAGDES